MSLVKFSDNGTSLEVIILGLGKICYENIHLIHFFQLIETFKNIFLFVKILLFLFHISFLLLISMNVLSFFFLSFLHVGFEFTILKSCIYTDVYHFHFFAELQDMFKLRDI